VRDVPHPLASRRDRAVRLRVGTLTLVLRSARARRALRVRPRISPARLVARCSSTPNRRLVRLAFNFTPAPTSIPNSRREHRPRQRLWRALLLPTGRNRDPRRATWLDIPGAASSAAAGNRRLRVQPRSKAGSRREICPSPRAARLVPLTCRRDAIRTSRSRGKLISRRCEPKWRASRRALSGLRAHARVRV